MQTCIGGHDHKSHRDSNHGAHELDPNPVGGCHGGEAGLPDYVLFFLIYFRVQMLLLDFFAG
jgi:hypothetical protein